VRLRKKAYSISETARLLSRLTTDDVEWLIDTGQLRPIVLCGQRLILASDIDELLKTYQHVQQKGKLDV
jgi:hypothetical protein